MSLQEEPQQSKPVATSTKPSSPEEHKALNGIFSSNWKLPGEGKKFSLDEVFSEINRYALKAEKEYQAPFEISIGTDSQLIKNGYRFVTVLCAHIKGKGGTYFYLTEFRERDLFQYNAANKKIRMFDEVAQSIELAEALFDKIGHASVVHIDASPADREEFTSGIVEQLKGYAISSGFEVKIKPESFTANFLADKHSKQRVTKRLRKHNKNKPAK